jgi:hypothetical protein
MSKDLVTIESRSGKGQFLVCEVEDSRVKIDVRLEDETVWLTQQLMADLFQTTKQNIGQHLKKNLSEDELNENSVVKKFFTTDAVSRFADRTWSLLKQSHGTGTAGSE